MVKIKDISEVVKILDQVDYKPVNELYKKEIAQNHWEAVKDRFFGNQIIKNNKSVIVFYHKENITEV